MRLAPLAAVVVVSSCSVSAQVAFEDRKIVAVDGATDDGFGLATALWNGQCLIGAYADSRFASSAGSVRAFDVATVAELYELLPSDNGLDDFYGVDIAVSDDIAVIGASYGGDDNSPNSGSAYVFDLSTGQQLFELLPDDGAQQDLFGQAVAIDGTYAVVGAAADDDLGASSGSAYVFDVTTGQQLFKLLPDDGVSGGFFGWDVAISGTTAVIGHPAYGTSGSRAAAYLFDVTTGQQLRKLRPVAPVPGVQFGLVVAAAQDIVIVGAPSPGGNDLAGGAFVFDLATGALRRVLSADDGFNGDRVGASIATDGRLAVLGAPSDFSNGVRSGAAYVFDVASGNQLAKLLPSDGASEDRFGSGVAIGLGTIVVGATANDEPVVDSGAAYIFSAPDIPCPADVNGDGELDPGDFTAWVAAFNAGDSLADQNRNDGLDPGDFTAWIANYNAGCP